MADIEIRIKNTFFEFGSSNEDRFAAAGCGMRRFNSCPSICSMSVDSDQDILSEVGSACPQMRECDACCDASPAWRTGLRLESLGSWATLTAVEDDDELSCCASTDPGYRQASPAVSEKAPVVAPVTPRTPLSSRARRFTPLSCRSSAIVPSCPQMAGALGCAVSRVQKSAPRIPEFAAERQQCTTVTMRNVPGRLSRDGLIKVFDEKGFSGLYNFVYCPVRSKTEMCMGYCFVNLVNEEFADHFMNAFQGFVEWPIASMKVCSVTWSETQGLNANIERYLNSHMEADAKQERFKPALFIDKKRVPFPE